MKTVLIKNVITPILLMLNAVLCVLGCLSERKYEHKIIDALLAVALFTLLLVSVGSLIK